MTHFKLNRRNFLVGGAAAVGGLSAFGGIGPAARLARAEGGADRYWIFCYFSGGWDTLLSLDPRDPNVFNNEVVGTTRIQPAYELLDDDTNDGSLVEAGGLWFGPYIGDMRYHADKMAVVRGMSMETLTHEAGRRRFITGKPPSGLLARGSSGATWLAGLFGEQELIPNLSVRVETYNVDNPTYATGLRVNSVPDLVRALRADVTALSDLEMRQIDQMLRDAAACERNRRSAVYRSSEESRLSVDAMVSSGVDVLFEFQAQSDAMAAIRQHYGIAPTGGAALQTPEAQGAMAVTALTSGVSRVVSIQVASGLDAHYDEWATDHGPAQERGFNVVARMIEDLEGREYKETGSSWLDHTTIVGFSEFSRTAMLNANMGRDHSLTASCFVAGAGIRGGRAIGKSSDVGMSPYACDLLTGEPDPGAEIIKPEHVYRALLHDVGVEGDPADLRVDPLLALLSNPS
jgi:uncharacterized protein (DUF1501 family)